MDNCIHFSPLNMAIKGTSKAIRNALSMKEMPAFIYAPVQTYTPENINESDDSIKTAKIIFTEAFYTNSCDLPWGALENVKFIMLCDGGDETYSDGTYAVFKDFGSHKVDRCKRFSQSSIHMEEFDNPEGHELIQKLRHSFLTEPWCLEYFDYSSGKTSCFKYPFTEKQAWQNDNLQPKDKHSHAHADTIKAQRISTPSSEQAVNDPAVTENSSLPKNRFENFSFSYADIGDIPAAFYETVLNEEKQLIPVSNSTLTIDGFHVETNVSLYTAEIAKQYAAPAEKWYDPLSSCERYICEGMLAFFPKPEEKLSVQQIQHRMAVFMKLCQLVTRPAAAQSILKAYPRKKNGMLYKNRILKIAWLYAVDWAAEKTTLGNGVFYNPRIYQLYATAMSDTELTITIRFCASIDTSAILANDDMSVKTNLFSSPD